MLDMQQVQISHGYMQAGDHRYRSGKLEQAACQSQQPVLQFQVQSMPVRQDRLHALSTASFIVASTAMAAMFRTQCINDQGWYRDCTLAEDDARHAIAAD